MSMSFKPWPEPVGAAGIAGIVDGEGSIFIAAEVRQRSGSRSLGIKPVVSVGNTCLALVERACEVAGAGSVSAAMKRTNGMLPFYQWRVKQHDAVMDVLRRIEPYLIAKRQRAATLLLAMRGKAALMSAPLLDAPRAALYQGVAVAQRRRLANRGQEAYAKLLLPWLREHQADSRSLQHVQSFIEVDD